MARQATRRRRRALNMFVDSRDQSRRFFVQVWTKLASGAALEPLESVIATVIRAHPEYHRVLDQGEGALGRDFAAGEANPFLHMGMHVALVEQLQSDRPPGIRVLYQQLLVQHGGDAHALEHQLLECLAAVLWTAQSSGRPPDEQDYLARVRRLLA